MEKFYQDHIRIIKSLNAVALTLVFPLLLVACSAGPGDSAGLAPSPVPSPTPSPVTDTIAPGFTFTAPTTGTNYTSTSANVTVSGIATDNVGLSVISWSNNKGGNGSVSISGTSANKSFNIALLSGINVITITILDTSGNSGQKQLTVTYSPVPPTSNSANLAWDSVVAQNLSGYRVYFGTAPGAYLQPYGQGVSVGNTTTYTLLGLSSGTRYYFAVTALDTVGNESGYSNEASKTIP